MNTVANTINNRTEPLQKYKLLAPTEKKQLNSNLGTPDFFPLFSSQNSNINTNNPEDTIDEKSISSGFSDPILFEVCY